MEKSKKERPQFKRFPTLKRAKGQRGNADIDIARLKEMYLEGTHYSWKSFCEVNHFNPQSNCYPWWKEKVPWEEWKREWVKRRTLLTDEEITPLMLDSTKLVAHGRIKFVQEWSSIAKNMKALLVHLMNEHVQNAAADQQAASFAQQVTGMKKLKLTIDELGEFAATGNRIAELEARAFLIVAGDPHKVRRQLDDDGDGKGGKNSEDPSEFDVVPLGSIMSAEERTKTIASYFDQFQKPPDPVPALAAPAEEPDAEDPS